MNTGVYRVNYGWRALSLRGHIQARKEPIKIQPRFKSSSVGREAQAERLGKGKHQCASGLRTSALRSLFNQLGIVRLQKCLNITDAAHLRPHASFSRLLHHLIGYQPFAAVHDLEVGIARSPNLAFNEFGCEFSRVVLHKN